MPGLSSLLNPRMFSKAVHYASDDIAKLRALDKVLVGGSGSVAGKKVLPAWGKYFMGPAHTSSRAMYGKTNDIAKLLGVAAGAQGLRYGGEHARPLYNSLSAISHSINNKLVQGLSKGEGLDSTYNLMKPGLAISSKPAMMADEALGNIFNAGAHPMISTFALPAAAYLGVRGGKALFSRLGRGRRLKVLQEALQSGKHTGKLQKAYGDSAQQLGLMR
jgi:hypothetical protein